MLSGEPTPLLQETIQLLEGDENLGVDGQRFFSAGLTNAPPHTTYIPTPDSTSIVDGYEELYPPGKWTDPATYIRSSETVVLLTPDSPAPSLTISMSGIRSGWRRITRKPAGKAPVRVLCPPWVHPPTQVPHCIVQRQGT